MTQNKIEFANSLRGIAALMVVVAHLYGVFWNNRDVVAMLTFSPVLPTSVATPWYIGLLWKVPDFSWGLLGVAIFFLVSGFVIPFSLSSLRAGQFLVSRAFRLVPTYAAGFTFTLLGVYLSTRYFSSSWDYRPYEVLIHYIPGLRDIAGTRGFDAVVWTLEVEVKFYLVCALAIGWFRRRSVLVFILPLILSVLAFAGSFWLKGSADDSAVHRLLLILIFNAQYIIFMFIGVAMNYLYRGVLPERSAFLLIAGLLFLFAIVWACGPFAWSLAQLWNYALAFLIFLFAFVFPNCLRSNRVLDFFAAISYPLYVSHAVFGFFVLRWLLDHGVRPSLSLMLVTAMSIFIAWGIHRTVEEPTHSFGRRMTAR